jgi:hypothetical protein
MCLYLHARPATSSVSLRSGGLSVKPLDLMGVSAEVYSVVTPIQMFGAAPSSERTDRTLT